MTIELIQKSGLQDLTSLKQAISHLVQSATELQVTEPSQFKTCTLLYSQAKDWKKIIEAKRKEAIEPDRKRIAMINDKAKELCDPLDQVEAITKRKVDSYQRLLEQIKKEEEEKIKKAALLLDEEEVPYIAPMDTSIRGDGAIAYMKVETRFEVVDISKIPLKYLKVDEAAIKQDIKLGIQEIPGVNIFEEKVSQLRKR